MHIKPSIDGRAAFDTVRATMEAARHNIDTITWSLDSVICFRRPSGPRIGKLLQAKGHGGVQARVLVWNSQFARLRRNATPGASIGGSGGI